MGKTIRKFKGEEHRDKSTKKKSPKKKFTWHDGNWATKGNGGPGNKDYWDGTLVTKDQYIKYKTKDYNDDEITTDDQ